MHMPRLAIVLFAVILLLTIAVPNSALPGKGILWTIADSGQSQTVNTALNEVILH